MTTLQFKSFSKKQLLVLNWWSENSPYKDKDAIILDGSIRSGKTLCMSLSFIIWSFYRFNDSSFAICGKTIRSVKRRLNPPLDIEGVLLTMFDGRTNFSAQVAAEVKKFFKGKVYNVVIPRNVRLSEAPSHGKPVIVYDRSSKGAVAYTELAKEIIKRNRQR